jgi:hypothetical protein
MALASLIVPTPRFSARVRPLSIEPCDGLRVAEQSCLYLSVRYIGKRHVIGNIALTLGLSDLNGLMCWMLGKS